MMAGGFPSRPRAWMGAEFVTKWPTGCKRWIPRDTADGGETQDANKGGKGGGDLRFCARSLTK